MRIIKFRCWNKEKEKMYDWETITGAKADGTIYWISLQDNKNILMQFTGFQFLGTDIYEGDILACEGGYEGNECEQPSVVYFDEDDVQFKTKCICGCGGYPLYEYDIYKIIGNIYENENLLTNNK